MSEPTTYNILFVCTGNTCRSPLAEAIARRWVEERGWRHVDVASAGIATVGGAPAAENAVAVAGRHGLELSGHRSRLLTRELIEWADLVLAMGPGHLFAARDLGADDRVALIDSFGTGGQGGEPVPDPFGGGEEVYEETFARLEGAVERALGRLEPILAP